MNKEINFTGLTAVPSGYDCPDGHLDYALNIINEDGALRHIRAPKRLMKLPRATNVFLHSTSLYTHYITWSVNHDSHDTDICVFDDESLAVGLSSDHISDIIKSFCAVGNTIIAMGQDNTHYFIWRQQSGSYTYLGTSLPKIDMDFALAGDIVSTEYSAAIELSDNSEVRTSDQNWTQVTSLGLNNHKLQMWSAGAIGMDGYRSDLIKLASEIKLIKGREYRLSIVWPKKYKVEVAAQLFSGVQYVNYENKGLVAEAELSFSKTFVADSDYTDLSIRIYVYPSAAYYIHNSEITCSVTLETSEVTHEEVATKVVKYTPESYQAVAAAINSFINRQATGKDKFIYPFFVRYAIRLYDGSYVSISSPCLMVPNSGYAPLVFYRESAPQLCCRAFVAELQYRINTIQNISDWKDIIDGIDIFVSQSVWPYDQGESYDEDKEKFSYSSTDKISSYGVMRLTHNGVEASSGLYGRCSIIGYINRFFETGSYNPTVLQLARRSDEDIADSLLATSNFYKVTSIRFDEIKADTEFTRVDIPKGGLSSLATKTPLVESVATYEGFADASAHSYNSRLHLFGASVILPQPQSIFKLQSFVNLSVAQLAYRITISLNTADGDKVVVKDFPAGLVSLNIPWFFYPDSRAYKATIALVDVDDNGDKFIDKVCEFPLKAHPQLNGAYAFSGSLEQFFGWEVPDDDTALLSVTAADKIPAPANIYVSEPGNPFVFRNSLVVSVGATEVMALSSAAKALSQGQFGQFPLYAFTDEGVWAMELTETGSYLARQPITRDVCRNPAAITQIDSAVLFPTDRGIMMLSGSNASCISDVINDVVPVDYNKIPATDRLLSMAGYAPDRSLPRVAFSKFIADCRMIYDYPHQRIIVTNTNFNYAYVLSLKSKLWGMMYSNICNTVNSYPEALAVDNDGNLLNFAVDDTQSSSGIMITRPIKLDSPDILKTVTTAIVRGRFLRGHVKTVLYGSRNLVDWHIICSSVDHTLRNYSGTPYKYFRIAAVTNLHAGESISSVSVIFTPRHTNKLR